MFLDYGKNLKREAEWRAGNMGERPCCNYDIADPAVSTLFVVLPCNV